MLTRTIPRTGEQLPVIGLGTWRTFDVGPAEYGARRQVLERFFALGGRLIDTSPMYGRAEEAVGALTASLSAPADLFLATKVWIRGQAAGDAQMRTSSEKLRTACVDLMQVHNLLDVETHLATLAAWKADGRVRYVGVTHYTVDSHRRLEPFLRRGEVDFVQCNYSLAVRDAERRLLPQAAEHGVAVLINRPFENGDVFAAAAQRPVPGLARELGCTTWAQLFLKYVLSHPAVTTVIPATASVAHLEENMQAGELPLPAAAEREALVRAWAAAV